ncbi:hypothetical protein J5N97_016411 [Dioscorea zingiberensis]|uniref:Uncharacterized protein n=1 Tax=Dioscorea zingiberensis TaxID=325984 RepID=A0A9D5HF57_9LILI|nr:hypothetical protein J5N97_016411 [Dioscorea zingiberensis]
MLRSCSCSGGSAAPVQLPNYRASSKVCKGCGGKLLVGRQGAISESMLSTVEMGLSRVIDPNLKWTNCAKGKQRALRRARTYSNEVNHFKIEAKSSKEVDTHNAATKIGHLPVSESEKLGVSILGRRFSDTPETVPFKKRKVPLVRSPSPPAESHPYLSDPGRILEIRCSYRKAEPIATQQSLEAISGFVVESDLRNIATYEVIKSDIDLQNADFSGISLLAAAACDSNIGDGTRNAEDSIANAHTSGGEVVAGLPASAEEHLQSAVEVVNQFQTSDKLDCRSESTLDHPTTSALPSKGTGDNAPHPSENISSKSKRAEFSSRDDRLHWDLNIVMDAWESNCDRIMNSEPPAMNVVGDDSAHDTKVGGGPCQEKLGLQKPGEDSAHGPIKSGNSMELSNIQGKAVSVELGLQEPGEDSAHGPIKSGNSLELSNIQGKAVSVELGLQEPGEDSAHGPIKSVNSVELSNTQGKAVSPSDNLVVDHHEGKECYLPHVRGDFPIESNQLEGDSVASLDALNNESPLYSQDRSSSISATYPGVLMDESVDASCLKFGSVAERDSSSCLGPHNNMNIDDPILACKPLPTMDKSPSEVVHEETISAASSIEIDHLSADTSLTIDVIREATNIRSPSDNNVPSYTNGPAAVKTNECSGVGEDVDEPSHMLVDRYMGKTTPVVSEVALTVDLEQNACVESADASKGASVDPSGSHPFFSHSIANHDEVSSGSADMDIDDSSCPVPDNDKLDLSKTYFPVQNGSEHSRCLSGNMAVGMADAFPAQGPSSSEEVNTICLDIDVNCTDNVVLENHVDLKYDPDASQTDDEHAVGIEKVDVPGDDASPYEDGEFRESVLNSWGADGETENVDYGSDHRENDIFEAASVNPHFNISECKNGQMLGADGDGQIEEQVDKKFMPSAVSQSLVGCFSMTDSSDAEVGKKCYRKVLKGASANHLSTNGEGGKIDGKMNTSVSGAVCHKSVKERQFLAEADGAYLKMRSTGWDRLPDGSGYGDEILDSGGKCAYQDHITGSAGAPKAGESLRRLTGSSLKNLSSQIDKPKPSDISYNKNNSYLRTNRVDDHRNPALKVERDGDDHRSVGRGGSPLNRYSRGRGHNWVDGHNHWSQYGPAGFTHSSSKNAAAAAVAKVESNGFVVAPDGTLVKAGGLGPSRRVLRHSASASSQNSYRSLGRRSPVEADRSYCLPLSFGNSRESPDRHISSGRVRAHPYGPQIQRDDYRKSFDQLDENIPSSLSLHRPLSRREHSFSPQERPLHMLRSRTGSPSRSRTRSPHNWTSSRRSENRRHGGPSSNLPNRSQNFKSQDRPVRVKSPQQGSGFGDHISPISRDHTSTPHSSRWINDRKDLLDFREHGYKQSSERSPPRRLFSRSNRADRSSSPRRLKQEDYHHPAPSGRFADFVGANRSSRHDGNRDDRRGNIDRYEMIRSVRQYDNAVSASTRQFHYDFEDGFRVHNPRTKVSSNFEQRRNSRDFDRGAESQLGDSARSTADKKGHFRYARDGKHTGNDKLHEIQQRDEDMDPRLRRTS